MPNVHGPNHDVHPPSGHSSEDFSARSRDLPQNMSKTMLIRIVESGSFVAGILVVGLVASPDTARLLRITL